MTNVPLDLSQLALPRSPQRDAPAAGSQARKNWVTRYLIPFGILFGFISLLGAAAGRRLVPQQSVTVIPVVVKRSAVQPAGTSLFQSPGWIEPRPTAIAIASLAPGVIEALLVVEGQTVTKDEPIARLVAIDAELDVEQAKNLLAIREGELNRAIAERNAAQIRFDYPVHLEVQLADADSILAKAQTELAKLPFLIEASEANVMFSRTLMQQREKARTAIAGRIVQESINTHASANANLQELQQRGPYLQHEVNALQNKVNAIKTQLKLLVEETGKLNEAIANVESATALRDEAKLRLRQAELTLHRNTIRAPMDGRILRLVASPGTRVMGLGTSGGQSASTVVEMYDPAYLQVRADVRLEDVPMVSRGQPVEIETASSATVIQGRVLQATSIANIQKNTLEVKVELIDPPDCVSPEMLVTATFLSPVVERSEDEPTETERMFVPSQFVHASESGEFVWIVDAESIARKRTIKAGKPNADGLREVDSGLQVTDKVIAGGVEELSEGSPVVVTGDEQATGF